MDFVSFEIAKKLKAKEFKEKCFAYYFPNGSDLCFNHNQFRGGIVEDCAYSHNSLPAECVGCDFVDAPTIEQVLKWLREKTAIAINIEYIPYVWQYKIQEMSFSNRFEPQGRTMFETYEQAALAGIEYVLDNLL